MDGGDDGVKKIENLGEGNEECVWFAWRERVCVCVDCELFVTVFLIRTIMGKNRFRF